MHVKDHSSDVIIIGGGNIGSAIAYGIARSGQSVVLLDEGDVALRAARGNFGLVWFQGKGLGMPRYVDWCLEATQKWPEFARTLEGQTGIAMAFTKPGGLALCRGEEGLEARKQLLQQLRQQTKSGEYPCEIITRREVEKLVPQLKLGPNIVGASFSPHDGHVNPLFLIRALRNAFLQEGGRYLPNAGVTDIRRNNQIFQVDTPRGVFQAPKVVLAAGVGIPPLAGKVGITAPVMPQRGQLLVTERLEPVLSLPISGIRQTHEGSFMFGTSTEDVGFNTDITIETIRDIAQSAIEAFPQLAKLRIVRSWAALRPLTPDKYPVYCESETHPGAFVVSSHSGVSLAPLYTTHVAQWIMDGTQPEGFEQFSPRRFDV